MFTGNRATEVCFPQINRGHENPWLQHIKGREKSLHLKMPVFHEPIKVRQIEYHPEIIIRLGSEENIRQKFFLVV